MGFSNMWTEKEEFVVETCEHWAGEADAQWVSSLTQVQRTALLPWWAKGIVDNGGFACFYEGAGLEKATDVADALRTIGLESAAEACRQTLSVFPNDPQLADLEYRRQWLAHNKEVVAPVFREADRVIWDLEDQLFDALARYIQANEVELRSPLK
jgi:hypothetical protein